MAAFLPEDQLPRIACQEAALTHLHPLAGDVSAATVVLCRALIRGIPWGEALAMAEADRNPETRQALREARASSGGKGGYAPEVLQSSVFFVTQSRDFREALFESLRFAGPANYCPVLVGPIAGARWGVDAINPELLAHLRVPEILPRVEKTAAALASGWGTLTFEPPA
jgi:ADP-ribosylglycohydrolase